MKYHSLKVIAFAGLTLGLSAVWAAAQTNADTPKNPFADDPAAAAVGGKIFAGTCSACHGEDANGSKDTGAPDLTDSFWLYGGDEESIYRTVWDGRQGHMPTWEKRLTETDRKILTLYVLDLKQGAP